MAVESGELTRLPTPMPQGRVGDTINALAQIPSPWVPHPPTFPDIVHQEPSDLTAFVVSKVVGEHYDQADTRNAAIPG